MHEHIHIHIYIYINREREAGTHKFVYTYISVLRGKPSETLMHIVLLWPLTYSCGVGSLHFSSYPPTLRAQDRRHMRGLGDSSPSPVGF